MFSFTSTIDRLKLVLKDLLENTVTSEDCADIDYIQELREEAIELVDMIEKEYSKLIIENFKKL
jgi:hypothetical protein